MTADLQASRTAGAGIGRHRREGVDQHRVAEHQRAHRRAAPGRCVQRNHVGLGLADVEQAIGRGGGVVDDNQTSDVVHQFGDRPDIGDRAECGRRRGNGHQAGVAGEQLLPLPGRQLAGLDVDLGPFHPGSVAVGRAQPGSDVGLVVEAADDHLAAQPGTGGGCIGQRAQQHGPVRAENDPGRVRVEQIGDRAAGGLQDRDAARGGRVRAGGVRRGCAEGGGDGGGDGLGSDHSGGGVETDPPVTKSGVKAAHPGDVVSHVTHL